MLWAVLAVDQQGGQSQRQITGFLSIEYCVVLTLSCKIRYTEYIIVYEASKLRIKVAI